MNSRPSILTLKPEAAYQMPGPLENPPHPPSQPVQKLVNRYVKQITETAGTQGLIALAVVGSAARGEETSFNGERISDIDFIAILRDANPITYWRLHTAARSLGIAIGCLPVMAMRKYRTIEFFEAKKTGWVAWGQSDIFAGIRMQTAADIPPWEAIRLVLNRAADCVKVRAGLSPTWYGAVKAYLALAEADLIFKQQDQPTYAGRWAQIAANGAVLGSEQLIERVRWATRIKLGLETPPIQLSTAEYETCLLDGIARLLAGYLGDRPDMERGLEILALQNHHWAHRMLYLAQHCHQPHAWMRCLRRDPIFPIWRSILAILAGQYHPSAGEMRVLLADFDRTLQPLQE